MPVPARPYYRGATNQPTPPHTHSRQGRLRPIHLRTAPNTQDRAEQYWVERRTRAVAGSSGQPQQAADALRIPCNQQLYSRGSTPSLTLLLPKSKSSFSLSGSSITGRMAAATMASDAALPPLRDGVPSKRRRKAGQKVQPHPDEWHQTSIRRLQARRSHSKPTPSLTTSLSLVRRAPRRTPCWTSQRRC